MKEAASDGRAARRRRSWALLHLLREVGELAVDLGQLHLFVGLRHVGVAFEFLAVLEQFELADRQQLGIGRGLEALGDSFVG